MKKPMKRVLVLLLALALCLGVSAAALAVEPDAAKLELYYVINGGAETDGDGAKEFDVGATVTVDIYVRTKEGSVTLQAYDIYPTFGANLTLESIAAPVKGSVAADNSYFRVSFNPSDALNLSVDTAGVKLTTVTLTIKDSIVYNIPEDLDFKAASTLSLDGTTKSFHQAASNLTLTKGQVETLKTYPVTYYDNVDGETITVPAAQEKQHNVALTLSADVPVRAGYGFLGWATTAARANAGTVDYAAGAGYASNAALDLYAVWDATDYTVTFAYTGTVPAGADALKPANKSGKHVGDVITVTVPALAGYTFSGWTASNATLDAENKFTMPAANVAFTGSWTANTYTVKFEKNAADATGTMADQSFTYNVAQALRSNVFARTSHTFGGWNTKADGSGTAYTDGQSVSNLTTEANGVVTLYAQWTIKTYTVVVSGGEHGGIEGDDDDTVTYSDVEHGSEITLPAPEPDPGYEFDGYYDGSGSKLEPDPDGKIPVTGNMDITIRFKPKDYTITFNTDGGAAIAAMTYNIESTAALPAASGKTGYAFTGWKVTTADGNWTAGDPWSAGAAVTGQYGNVTLTAQWKLDVTMKVEKYQYVNTGYALLLIAPNSELPAGQTYFYNYGSEKTALYSTTNADYQKLISDTYSGTVYFTLVKTNAAETQLHTDASITLENGTAEALNERNGDVNGDNRVDITDANLVFQMILDRDHYALNAISVKGRLIADMITNIENATYHANINDVAAIVGKINL